MIVIIHDLSNEQWNRLFPDIDRETHMILSDTGTIRNCTGCFGCWIRTPGKCVIKDDYDNMGKLLSRAERIVIISRCCYGGYSPFVKTVLERSISYLLPFFRIKNKETHHKPRYKNRLQFLVHFYGEHITPQEMETAQNLVKANSINFCASSYQTSFSESPAQLRREDVANIVLTA